MSPSETKQTKEGYCPNLSILAFFAFETSSALDILEKEIYVADSARLIKDGSTLAGG